MALFQMAAAGESFFHPRAATYIYTSESGAAGGPTPYTPYYQQIPSHYQASPAPLTYVVSASAGTASLLHQLPHSSPSSVDDDNAAGQLSHTTRASPATIQWLLQNYETAEGVSLPRCTLYSHYLRHCQEHKLDPVNAASFGKLIRSVFLGLRTRRLGTRGNSKYHYYGIRIKADSPLNGLGEEAMPMAMRQTPSNPARRQGRGGGGGGGGGGSYRNEMGGQSSEPSIDAYRHADVTPAANPTAHASYAETGHHGTAYQTSTADGGGGGGVEGAQSETYKDFLGQGHMPEVAFPVVLDVSLDDFGLKIADVHRFCAAYRRHCDDILGCVKNLNFGQVAECWRNFWQPESDLDADDQSLDGNPYDMSQTQLFSLCTIGQIQHFVQQMDCEFYQALVRLLIPKVLNVIPNTLIQQIRNFAKSLESQLSVAMQGAPEAVQKIKLAAVKSLAQTLRRYTSLNHLAQAARAVLTNPTQIQQMLADLNRVDFSNVQEQASWVCHCDFMLVDQLQKNFKSNLEKQLSLESWADWLQTVVDQVLAPFHDDRKRMAHAAKQFLLKWSFYSSMVIRDLTLRSAQSFGSFHLIRLLYDEYMFYLIEQKIGHAFNETTIAVMIQPLLPNMFVGSQLSAFSLDQSQGNSHHEPFYAMENQQQLLTDAPVAVLSAVLDEERAGSFTNGDTPSPLAAAVVQPKKGRFDN